MIREELLLYRRIEKERFFQSGMMLITSKQSLLLFGNSNLFLINFLRCLASYWFPKQNNMYKVYMNYSYLIIRRTQGYFSSQHTPLLLFQVYNTEFKAFFTSTQAAFHRLSMSGYEPKNNQILITLFHFQRYEIKRIR